MDYEIAEDEGRGYAIRNGHYHIHAHVHVLMCDEHGSGSKILAMHECPLHKWFISRIQRVLLRLGSRDCVTWREPLVVYLLKVIVMFNYWSNRRVYFIIISHLLSSIRISSYCISGRFCEFNNLIDSISCEFFCRVVLCSDAMFGESLKYPLYALLSHLSLHLM